MDERGIDATALLCVAPEIAQERRMLRVAKTRLTHIHELVLWTTEVLLNEYGPRAPIWLKYIPLRSQVEQPSNLLRQIIFDIVPEKIET